MDTLNIPDIFACGIVGILQLSNAKHWLEPTEYEVGICKVKW